MKLTLEQRGPLGQFLLCVDGVECPEQTSVTVNNLPGSVAKCTIEFPIKCDTIKDGVEIIQAD